MAADQQMMWNPDMRAYMPLNDLSWLGPPSYEYPMSVNCNNTSATFGDQNSNEVFTQDDRVHVLAPIPRIDEANGASLNLLNTAGAGPVCHQESGQTHLLPGDGGKKRIIGAQDAAISLDVMRGHLSFHVQIAKGMDHGSGWTFSPELQILYIEKGRPVDFELFYKRSNNLRIRVMAVYASDELSNKVVKRCHNHVRLSDSSNASHQHPEHVVRASLTNGTRGTYVEDECTGRYSVVLPLAPSGDGQERLTCMFMCQSTCVLNPEVKSKRTSQQLGILVLLEHADGTVVGRDLVRVRCCSNPSRDKESDLKKLNGRFKQRSVAGGKRTPTPSASPDPPRLKTQQIVSSQSVVVEAATSSSQNWNNGWYDGIRVPGKPQITQLVNFCMRTHPGV